MSNITTVLFLSYFPPRFPMTKLSAPRSHLFIFFFSIAFQPSFLNLSCIFMMHKTAQHRPLKKSTHIWVQILFPTLFVAMLIINHFQRIKNKGVVCTRKGCIDEDVNSNIKWCKHVLCWWSRENKICSVFMDICTQKRWKVVAEDYRLCIARCYRGIWFQGFMGNVVWLQADLTAVWLWVCVSL